MSNIYDDDEAVSFTLDDWARASELVRKRNTGLVVQLTDATGEYTGKWLASADGCTLTRYTLHSVEVMHNGHTPFLREYIDKLNAGMVRDAMCKLVPDIMPGTPRHTAKQRARNILGPRAARWR
jgi:hypothetical protein